MNRITDPLSLAIALAAIVALAAWDRWSNPHAPQGGDEDERE